MIGGSTVVVAGATGNLGARITSGLEQGALVKALVRRDAAREKSERLRKLLAAVAVVDWGSAFDLERACSGASCLVSAIAGLRDVIVEAQTRLLEAAVQAGHRRLRTPATSSATRTAT